MGPAIGSILGEAVGVAISPLPIVAVILVLFAPSARTAGPAFLAGWMLGLAVASTLFTLLGPLGAAQGPGPALGVVKLVLGLLFWALAVRQWRHRPTGDEPPALPGWMSAIDRYTPARAFVTGLVLVVANPKNLGLSAAAGGSIGAAELAAGGAALAIAVFVVLASTTIALPVLGTLVVPARSQPVLDRMRVWLTANNATVMLVLFAVLGAKLVGDGIGILGSA